MPIARRHLLFGLGVLVASTFAVVPLSARAADGKPFSIAGGKLALSAPAGWVEKQPRTRIVETEFEVPPVTGDMLPGRVTVMGAGGSIEANIDRWYAQFTQPGGGVTRDKAKVRDFTADGQKVVVVDVSGTYNDAPPFGGTGTQRPGYRMLAAIISTEDAGNYFIKFYGPERTVAEYEAEFTRMLETLDAK